MSDRPVSVLLEVEVNGREVLAKLKFTNNTKKSVWLYKHILGLNGKLTNRLFEITCEGKKVTYTGKMIKRRAPTAKDFLELEAEDELETEVPLHKYYRFLEGKHEYVAIYDAYVTSYGTQRAFPLSSNEVAFVVPSHTAENNDDGTISIGSGCNLDD